MRQSQHPEWKQDVDQVNAFVCTEEIAPDCHDNILPGSWHWADVGGLGYRCCVTCWIARCDALANAPVVRSDLPITPPATSSPPRGDGCTGHAAAKKLDPRKEPEPIDEPELSHEAPYWPVLKPWHEREKERLAKEAETQPDPEHAVAGIAFEPWALTMLTAGCLALGDNPQTASGRAETALDLILAVRERRGW